MRILFFCILLGALLVSCGDDDIENDGIEIECEADCYSMGWGIVGEAGTKYIHEECTRRYTSLSYVETCTGTLTYSISGNSYDYTVTYDWPKCSISVKVEGVGECYARSGTKKAPSPCNCGEKNIQDMAIKKIYSP